MAGAFGFAAHANIFEMIFVGDGSQGEELREFAVAFAVRAITRCPILVTGLQNFHDFPTGVALVFVQRHLVYLMIIKELY